MMVRFTSPSIKPNKSNAGLALQVNWASTTRRMLSANSRMDLLYLPEDHKNCFILLSTLSVRLVPGHNITEARKFHSIRLADAQNFMFITKNKYNLQINGNKAK